jgi:hypothetical protein
VTRYELFLFLHIACVSVWLGSGTALAVLSFRAPIVELAEWLGPRVFGPASLGSLAFGLALVFDGHWTFSPLWIQLGLGAFALSTIVNAGLRLPVIRRNPPDRDRKLRALAALDLTVLFLASADMVAKPTGDDVATLAVGGAILALVALAGVARVRTGRPVR